MYSARLSLALFIAWLLAQAQTKSDRVIDQSQAYQNIDAYLKEVITDCSSELDFINQVEQSIAQARDAIEMVAEAMPDKTTFDEPNLCELTKNKITIMNLRPILHHLLLASKSCDAESIDFLNIVAKYTTFEGQLLNEFTASKINRCWHEHVVFVSKMVARKLAKDNSSVFEFIDHLTNTARQMKARTGTIQIFDNTNLDQEPSIDQLKDMLKAIDSVKIASDPKILFLKRSLDLLFLASLGSQDIEDVYGNSLGAIKRDKRNMIRSELVEPCESVIERFKQLEASGEHYQTAQMRLSFRDILVDQADSDDELCRTLLYLEVCKRATSREFIQVLLDSV